MSQTWLYPTVLLCIYGFFSNLRPAEPFLTAFLLGPDKNLTETEVMSEIFPIWTYSYLILLFPVFLATDYLCYKPVLIVQAASLIVTYTLLVKGQGVLIMQLLEFFFGMATATDVAYYAYIYSVVERDSYQRVTGLCRSTSLLGSAVGSFAGQILVSMGEVPLRYLVAVTLASSSLAFVAPWFMPMPRRSLFFHKESILQDESAHEPVASSQLMEKLTESDQMQQGGSEGDAVSRALDSLSATVLFTSGLFVCHSGNVLQASVLNLCFRQVPTKRQARRSLLEVLRSLWADFLRCFSCRTLLAWSVWWALSTCGYFQVINYTQVLWEKILPSKDLKIYNGYVETISTLIGALAAFGVGFVKVSWEVWGELALCMFSTVIATAVYLMHAIKNIWVCYSSYVVFRAAYMLLITIATYQIAVNLSMRRYALVFGVNTFVALLLQTLLTVTVVDSAGLGLDIFPQFLIYSCYFAVIAGVFLVAGVYKVATHHRAGGTKMQHETDSTGGDPPL